MYDTKMFIVRIESSTDLAYNYRQHNRALTYNDAQKLRDALIKSGKYLAKNIVVRAAESTMSAFTDIVDLTK